MSDNAGAGAPYVPGNVLNEEQKLYVTSFLSTEIKDVLDGSERAAFLQKVAKWRRMARVEPEQASKTYPWQDASNVVTPIVAQKVNVVFAKLIAMFSSKRPFWDVQTDDYALLPVNNAIAKYMNFLASAPFHLNIENANRSMFYDLVLIGSQMVKVPWLFEQWQVKTEQGMVNRVMHNGPAIVPIRIEDFLIRSYYDDVQRAPWVGNLVWLTEAELKQRENMGIYENVESMLGAFASELHANTRDELERRGLSSALQNSYAETRIYPIFEGYVYYDADGDGVPEDIKVWLEPVTGTLLRSESNVLGVRDLVAMSYFKVPRQLYGVGIGHLLEGLQEEADFVHNHRADNLHFSLIPMFKRRRGSMEIKKDEIHPGKFIDLDDINDLQPFMVPDLTGSTYQAEMLVRDYADRVSGANDPMSGYGDSVMKSGGDTSAMTFLAQQGSSILNAIYEGIEENYGEIGQLILIQLVANKDKVDTTQILTPEEQTLFQTVLDMPLESLPTTFRFRMKTTDINRTEDAKLAQLKEATGLFMNYGQQMTQVLMTMANPQVPPLVQQFMQQLFVGGTNFVKQVMKAYKIEGVDQMFPNVGGGSGGEGGGAGSGFGSGAQDAGGGVSGVAPAGGMAPQGASSAGAAGVGGPPQV